MVFHTALFAQATHFSANEVQQWVHAYEIYWFYHVPHHPEEAGLIE